MYPETHKDGHWPVKETHPRPHPPKPTLAGAEGYGMVDRPGPPHLYALPISASSCPPTPAQVCKLSLRLSWGSWRWSPQGSDALYTLWAKMAAKRRSHN